MPFACLTAAIGLPIQAAPINFFVMVTNEFTKLTPAQKALLNFASHREASGLYRHLSDTLGLCIVNYLNQEDKTDPSAAPTPRALEAWYFTLEMLNHLQALAEEEGEGVSL